MSSYNGKKGAFNLTGIPGVSDVYQVTTTSTSAGPFNFWNKWFKPRSNMYMTLAEAEAALTGGINEVVLLSPESHSLSATLTWDKNMTHLVGEYPSALMNHRSRIGMSTAFSPMITVSGYGNLFKNIYTMHGTAAADYIGWSITGARNTFEHCHFGGPMAALQGGHASYEGLAIDGSENYFKNCVIGTDTIGRDETSPNVTLGAGTLTVFENCLFLANLTDGDPVFVAVENSSGYTWALFKNCAFMAFSSNYATAMTYAFKFSSGSSAAMVLDPACTFQNVAHLAASANHIYIWQPTVFAATADELNQLAIHSATY